MPNRSEVLVQELKEVHDLPDGWTSLDFIRFLDRLEYDDAASISPEELKDMACLAPI